MSKLSIPALLRQVSASVTLRPVHWELDLRKHIYNYEKGGYHTVSWWCSVGPLSLNVYYAVNGIVKHPVKSSAGG